MRFGNGLYTKASNVIMYDVLENAGTPPTRWKGTLQNIDVTQLTNKGINAKVYYWTVPNLNPNNGMDGDLSNTAIWSTISITKTSNPTSGTQGSPAVVTTMVPISYTVTIKNTGTMESIQDISVADAIPIGLMIDTEHIQYYFGTDSTNAALISGATRVNCTAVGQNLVFHANTLVQGEIVNYVIPTTVGTEVANGTYYEKNK